MRYLCEKAWAQGWSFEQTKGNHWRIITPTGPVILSSTPGNLNEWKRDLSRLKQAGLEVSEHDKPRNRLSGLGAKPEDVVGIPRNLKFDHKRFAAALKGYQQGHELTRDELAGLLGVSASTIWQWQH